MEHMGYTLTKDYQEKPGNLYLTNLPTENQGALCPLNDSLKAPWTQGGDSPDSLVLGLQSWGASKFPNHNRRHVVLDPSEQ